MATRTEVARLSALSPDDADAGLLGLMIPHHQAAIVMAESVIEESGEPQVIRFARNVIASQSAEIETMMRMLEDRGFERVSTNVSMPEAEPESYGGFTSSVADFSADLIKFFPLSLGLFAAFWLGADTLHRRSLWVARESTDAPPPAWRAIAVAGFAITGIAHLALAPEHFAEAASYGIFFSVAAAAALLCAAALIVRQSRPLYAGGCALASLLVVVFIVFRLVPSPGASSPEHLDLVGLAIKASEVIAGVACAFMWQGAQTRAVRSRLGAAMR